MSPQDEAWREIVEQLRAHADTRYRRREIAERLVIVALWMFPVITGTLLAAAVWAWVVGR